MLALDLLLLNVDSISTSSSSLVTSSTITFSVFLLFFLFLDFFACSESLSTRSSSWMSFPLDVTGLDGVTVWVLLGPSLVECVLVGALDGAGGG